MNPDNVHGNDSSIHGDGLEHEVTVWDRIDADGVASATARFLALHRAVLHADNETDAQYLTDELEGAEDRLNRLLRGVAS